MSAHRPTRAKEKRASYKAIEDSLYFDEDRLHPEKALLHPAERTLIDLLREWYYKHYDVLFQVQDAHLGSRTNS